MNQRKYLVIAVFKDISKVGKKPATVGYRIFDTEAGTYVDFPVVDKAGINFAVANANKFLNVEPECKTNLSFKFTNGQESRYPMIDCATGNLMGKNPLVIVKEFLDGYRIVDAFGHTFDWTDDVTLKYAAIQGIANGKQVVLNGKPHISSISGQYPKENISIVPKAVKGDIKGKPAKVSVYPDTFYKSLEPMFGGVDSVNILRHLFENRGQGTKETIQVIAVLKDKPDVLPINQLPALLGIRQLCDDWKVDNYQTSDKKLQKLVEVVTEPKALKLIYDVSKDYGIDFLDLWGTKIITPLPTKVKLYKNIIITEAFTAAKLANYTMKKGKVIYQVSVNSDGSELVYGGKQVKKDGFMLSGIKQDCLTITDVLGKTQTVRMKKEV